jgi:cytochrome c5
MIDTPRWLLAPMLLASAVFLGPEAAQAQARERAGKEVVDAVCAACHATGEKGAPKVGDRAAWAPRLKQGMDALALKAIRGHDGMPPRGGTAALTDGEIKAAINYMFNPASAQKKAAASAALKTAPNDRAHKLVAGTDVYLGLLPANAEKGKGYYRVSIVLRDHASRAEIKDAQVEARVANLMTGETKKLESETVNNAFSYGNYFQMPGKDPYTVTVKVLKPGAAPVEAKFDVKR